MNDGINSRRRKLIDIDGVIMMFVRFQFSIDGICQEKRLIIEIDLYIHLSIICDFLSYVFPQGFNLAGSAILSSPPVCYPEAPELQFQICASSNFQITSHHDKRKSRCRKALTN